MKKWSKEDALVTLNELSVEADRLRSSEVFSAAHVMWMMKCSETFEEVFGRTSRYYLSFNNISWGTADGTIDTWEFGGNFKAAVNANKHEYFLKHLESSKGFLLAAAEYLKNRKISEVYNEMESGNEASLVLSVLHLAEQKLRKVIRDKPEKENEVQDAFENLLIGADIPYGREIEKIEYSSKTYTPDFSLPKLDMAVEVKLCSRKEREKELPEEINDDILAYQTKYQNILFIVYDLGFIRDKDKFCSSFEEHDNVTVRVIKH